MAAGFGSTSFQVQGSPSQPAATVTVSVVAPTPGPVSVSPTSWTFDGVGQGHNFTIATESNYTGAFSAAVANSSIATVLAPVEK
jgi:hypothetical protein